jgi:hypothetical protein
LSSLSCADRLNIECYRNERGATKPETAWKISVNGEFVRLSPITFRWDARVGGSGQMKSGATPLGHLRASTGQLISLHVWLGAIEVDVVPDVFDDQSCFPV